MTIQIPAPERIAQLNDVFRKTGLGGHILLTAGIKALTLEEQNAVWRAVQAFDSFTEGNDPYGEHDFGSFMCNGRKIFWKIDYYGKEMTFGSEDPADASRTTRVLTVMLAEEY